MVAAFPGNEDVLKFIVVVAQMNMLKATEVFFFPFFFLLLKIEPRASHMLSIQSATSYASAPDSVL